MTRYFSGLSTRACTTVLLTALLFCVPGIARAQGNTPLNCTDPGDTLLWQVEGIAHDVYLFGSIHLGNASFYPLQPPVEAAFSAADFLVFEADLGAATDMQLMMEIQRRGMLPQGERLDELVSAATVAKLEQVLGEMGMPASTFMGMQPWFLNVVLASLQMTMHGFLPQYGVENYFLTRKPAGMQLLELESIEQQIGFLESLNGENYLRYTLESFDTESSEEIEALISAWRCADKEVLEDMIFSDFEEGFLSSAEMENLQETLFLERNRDMAGHIMQYIEDGGGDYFVVVGSGHLLGEGSIIDVLENAGYGLRPVRNR